MTLVLVCLLVAVLMPYVLAGVTGYHKTRQLGAIDNIECNLSRTPPSPCRTQ